MARPASPMPPFRPLTSFVAGPRLRQFTFSNIVLNTPSFILPTSRGVVPHLSHDNLRDHTSINCVGVALEDFLEKYPSDIPLLNASITLRAFTSLPATSLLLLSARRNPPVPTAASNTDDSIAILTSVGFRNLKLETLLTHLPQLSPDILVSPPDIPSQLPGKMRIPKMVYRTEKWLAALIPRAQESGTSIFASILPLSIEQQSLYLEYLVEIKSSLFGLALYDTTLIPLLPSELADLPRLSMDAPETPLKVLEQVENGVDLFSLNFPGESTDAGIALTFSFPGEPDKGKKVLGLDLWDTTYSTDLAPLQPGCICYACCRHHRAFIRHLLNAKEMTAWVLLQIHNARVLNAFFASIRTSISAGTFESDKEVFARTYEASLPQKTGEGPRVRGYMFKSEGGAKKKNPRGFEKLQTLRGDKRETLEDATPPPDAGVLEESGFAERVTER